jgi:hypothetical protein
MFQSVNPAHMLANCANAAFGMHVASSRRLQKDKPPERSPPAGSFFSTTAELSLKKFWQIVVRMDSGSGHRSQRSPNPR